MSSKIMRIVVGAERENVIKFDEAEKEALQKLDGWREKENPKILSVNFGRQKSMYLSDIPGRHNNYIYIEVLYDE